ncbi:cytochrome P450 [Serendipita vermifera]|nr:cytochrome P450 [Serendipita vermifera]
MDTWNASQSLVWPLVAGVAASGLIYALKPKAIGDIPHGSLTFLVGDFPAILDSVKQGLGIGHWISQQSFKHGPIMSIHMGPLFTKVAITDPEEIEDILHHRMDDFVFSDTQKAVFGGAMPFGMLSIPTNAMWTAHRRALSPCMGTQYLKQFTPKLAVLSRQLGDLWQLKHTKMPNGSCFDTSEDFQLLTMDMISSFTFGDAFGGLEAAIKQTSMLNSMQYDGQTDIATFEDPHVEMHNAVRVLFKVMGEAALSPFPNFTYWLWKRRQEWKSAHKLFFDYLDVRIEQARLDYANERDVDSRKGTVPHIVFAREEYRGPFPMDELKDELLNFLLAVSGQDTTGTAIQWASKILSHHPEVQRKLRDHLDAKGIFGLAMDGEIAYEDVRTENVPYLEAVVWEILRISQIGVFISRMASRDTTIMGYAVPKGTEIILHVGHAGLYNTVANARRARALDSRRGHSPKRITGLWKDDGVTFDPERWIDEDGRFNHSAGLALPFGGGPRMCFGYKLALLQIKFILIELSRRFFLKPPSNPDINSWKVIETVNRAPLHNYVVLESWHNGSTAF